MRIVFPGLPAVSAANLDDVQQPLLDRCIDPPAVSKIVADAAANGCEGVEVGTEPGRIERKQIRPGRGTGGTSDAIPLAVFIAGFRQAWFADDTDAGVKADIPATAILRNGDGRGHRHGGHGGGAS